MRGGRNRRFDCISKRKHSVHLDALYEVQLKNSILDINVPSPRHLTLGEDSISYPYDVKVDMSSDGIGNHLVKNEGELSTILRQIGDLSIPLEGRDCVLRIYPWGQKMLGFQFDLHKSGEVFWVGTTTGTFDGIFGLDLWNGGLGQTRGVRKIGARRVHFTN